MFLQSFLKLFASFRQLGFQNSLEDAVDGDDAWLGCGLEQPHANQSSNQLRPRIAFAGGSISGQFRVALSGNRAHPRQRHAVRCQQGGNLQNDSRRSIQPGQRGPQRSRDFAQLAHHAFAAAGLEVFTQFVEVISHVHRILRLGHARIALPQIDGSRLHGEGESAQFADNFTSSSLVFG